MLPLLRSYAQIPRAPQARYTLIPKFATELHPRSRSTLSCRVDPFYDSFIRIRREHTYNHASTIHANVDVRFGAVSGYSESSSVHLPRYQSWQRQHASLRHLSAARKRQGFFVLHHESKLSPNSHAPVFRAQQFGPLMFAHNGQGHNSRPGTL